MTAYSCGCVDDLWCVECARAVQPEGEFGDLATWRTLTATPYAGAYTSLFMSVYVCTECEVYGDRGKEAACWCCGSPDALVPLDRWDLG